MVYYNEDNTGLLQYMKTKHPEFFEKQYTRKQFLDILLSLQEELIRQLPKNNCDIRRVTDIENYLKCKASKRGLSEDAEIEVGLDEIAVAFEDMQKLISVTIAGMNGERRVLDELDLIDGMDIEIMPNVNLSFGECKCEIDCVVITNYGVYCIEVKTPSTDMMIDEKGYLIPQKISRPIRGKRNNVVHQCRVQQHVLKQYLGSDKDIKSFVVCGNWDTEIIQKYDSEYIDTVGIGELVDRIMEDASDNNILFSEADIASIKKTIEDESYELMFCCELDIEGLLKKYEFLLKNIIYTRREAEVVEEENARKGSEALDEDVTKSEDSQEYNSFEDEHDDGIDKKIFGLTLGAIAVAGVAVFASMKSAEKTAKSLLDFLY